jgi:hypothetical protein
MTHPSFAGAVNFGQATRTPNVVVVVVVLCWLFILGFDQLMERFLNVESSRNFFWRFFGRLLNFGPGLMWLYNYHTT